MELSATEDRGYRIHFWRRRSGRSRVQFRKELLPWHIQAELTGHSRHAA